MPSHIQAKTKALSPDQPLSERFEDFFTTIAKADEHSCMKALDVAAAHAALKITVLYKAKHQNHLHPAMECDLFLEEIWITYRKSYILEVQRFDSINRKSNSKFLDSILIQ